jgi:hypothetical protein
VGAGAKAFVTAPLPGTENNPVIWNPVTQFQKDWQGVKDWNELRKADPDYAWGNMLGGMLVSHTLSKLIGGALPKNMGDKLAAGAHVNPDDVEPVVKDLRAARSFWQKPRTVGDFVGLASDAQKNLDTEYANALGKYSVYKGNLPDANGRFPLSDAILELKDKYPAGTEWGNAARRMLDQRAAEYQRPVSLGDLDLERKNANSRIDAYEAMSQLKQAGKRLSTPEIAVDQTIANWVRDNVYPEMDQLTGKQPGYFRDLKLRVGNLMRLQSDAQQQAEKMSLASGIERGTPKISHARLGASVGPTGEPHGWIGNIASVVHTPDPEAAANTAVSHAFDARRVIAPSKATRQTINAAQLPVSVLMGGAATTNSVNGPAQRLVEYLRDNPQQ